MAPKLEENDDDDGMIDRDDSLTDTEEFPYEKLMGMLNQDDAGEDTVAFGEGSGDDGKVSDIVSVEDGIDLIDDAGKTARKDAVVEKPDTEAEGDAKPVDDDGKADEGAKVADTSEDAALEALLSGMEPDKQTAIRARVTEADEIMGIFKGREKELESLGAKPQDAMRQLVTINDYARKNPGDYLAWAAKEFGDPAELLGAAAKHHGLKLVPIDDDGDFFEDPEIKEMREENKRLKAERLGPQLGPESQQFQTQSALEKFAAESPHWEKVGPDLAAMVQVHVEKSKNPATIDDVKRLYRAAVLANGLDLAPTPPVAGQKETPAAQAQQPVAEVKPAKTAADSAKIERAKAASKSLDGSGQGAGRRPAAESSDSIHGFLSAQFAKQSKS